MKSKLTGSLVDESIVLNGTLSDTNSAIYGVLSNLGIRGYSPYDLAIKHGFAGTEEEWLKSLNGSEIELRENDKTIEWKYSGEDEWRILIDLKTANDYDLLSNKPQINSVELKGNLDLKTLGIQEEGNYADKSELPGKLSNMQIENILKLGGLV